MNVREVFSSTSYLWEGIKDAKAKLSYDLPSKRLQRNLPSASETLMWNELHVSIVWLRYGWNSTNCFLPQGAATVFAFSFCAALRPGRTWLDHTAYFLPGNPPKNLSGPDRANT